MICETKHFLLALLVSIEVKDASNNPNTILVFALSISLKWLRLFMTTVELSIHYSNTSDLILDKQWTNDSSCRQSKLPLSAINEMEIAIYINHKHGIAFQITELQVNCLQLFLKGCHKNADWWMSDAYCMTKMTMVNQRFAAKFQRNCEIC